MTDSENRTAKAIAREVLQEFFLTIGVDITTPGNMIELQKDLHHIRAARHAIDKARATVIDKVLNALTGAAVTAIIGAIGVWLAHH